MPHDVINYIYHTKDMKSQEIVRIPVSLDRSSQGKYFVGQTKPLFVSDEKIAWAGLVNPCNSGVNLFANVFTVSNFSEDYITAEIWLNTDFPKEANISRMVSPTNTSLCPHPQNKVAIKFIKSTNRFPQDGVNVYRRIVPPNTTLVGEEDGKFIEAPGGNYTLILKSPSIDLDKIIVAFGWWEEPIDLATVEKRD